jgi:hypothetical protein
MSEDGKLTSVAARLGPHYMTLEFADGLQSLGFEKHRIPTVVDALRLLAHEASKLHVNTAFTAISTQKSTNARPTPTRSIADVARVSQGLSR